MQQIIKWSDLALFIVLLGLGVLGARYRPWGLPSADTATLAGALFGSAALLLGNWINRFYTINQARQAELEYREKIKTMIAGELVNVAIGLIDSKRLMDAAIGQIQAGGNPPGTISMNDYLPRSMPFTEALGVELLKLEKPAVDAITMLRINLALTRQQMEAERAAVATVMGLSLLTATSLSKRLGFDMTVLIDALRHIAPDRKIRMEEGGPVELLMAVMERAARPTAI